MKRIVGVLVGWRVLLFIIAFLATVALPVSRPLFPYRNTVLTPTGLPSWVFGFGNFDGVHYIRIALMGYKESQYSEAFFPLYPLALRVFSSYSNYFWVGLLLSNTAFFIGTVVLYKLFLIDFDKKISYLSILLLLCFPTAFYFGALYTEGFLLLFAALTFFFLRQKRFLLAGLCIGLAGATRLIGVCLLFPLLYELFVYFKRLKKVTGQDVTKGAGALLLGISGMGGYMIYLYSNFKSPFLFLISQFSLNTGRRELFVLLPQVLYRYIKIFLNVPVLSWPFFNAFLEVLFSAFVIFLLIYCFNKTNKGYWLFAFFSTLLPTLTGTLSSMPRYVLVTFILFPLLVKLSGKYIYALLIFLAAFEVLLSALFIQGYWIA